MSNPELFGANHKWRPQYFWRFWPPTLRCRVCICAWWTIINPCNFLTMSAVGPAPQLSAWISFMDDPFSAQKASQFGLGSCSALLRETGSDLRFINRGLVQSPLTPFIRSSRLVGRLLIIPLPNSLSHFYAWFIYQPDVSHESHTFTSLC